MFTTFQRCSDRLCTGRSGLKRVNNGRGNCARMTSAELEYLKICVIDALKDKRWCSGLQREDNTGLNGGEQQVGGAHSGTLTHTRVTGVGMAMRDCRDRTHHRVLDRVHQSDDVGSSSQVLKDFNLPFDLLLLDRLEVKKKKTISCS